MNDHLGSQGSVVGDPLLARLISVDWRIRQEAIDELVKKNNPDIARAVLEIVRQQHANLNALSAALKVLEHVGKPLVDELIALLYSPDVDLRVFVPLVLSELDGPKVTTALLAAAEDPMQPENVRFNAIEALGKIQAEKASDRLLALAHIGTPFLRYAALVALGQIAPPGIEMELIPLLEDEYLAEPSIFALGKTGGTQAVMAITKWMLIHSAGEGIALQAIFEIARRESSEERVIDAFLNAAGEAGQTQVLAMAEVLDDEHPDDDSIWEALASVAGWITMRAPGNKHAGEVLVKLLRYPRSRRTAEYYLMQLPKPPFDALLDTMENTEGEPYFAAARVIAAKAGEHELPEITKWLSSPDENIVALAVDGLAHFRSPAVFDALVKTLGDSRAYVRGAAIEALVKMDIPNLSSLAASLQNHEQPEVRESSLRLLARRDTFTATQAALYAARDPDANVRRAAMELLPLSDIDRAAEILGKGISDPDAGVRKASIEACARLPHQKALSLLKKALDVGTDWDRVQAVRGLGGLADPVVIQTLEFCLDDPFPPLRLEAVNALVRLSMLDLTDEMIWIIHEHLRAARADEDSAIRNAALVALGENDS